MRSVRATAFLLVLMILVPLTAVGREIEDAMGTVQVPEAPARVVALTNEATEALLALGITPVGAVRSWHGDPWYDHIAGRMEGVPVVGTEHALNLEMIAALQPDLIIGNKHRQAEFHDHLSAIAPTVFSATLLGRWAENLRLYAEAVGRQDQGADLLAAFDDRIRTISAGLGDRLQERISLVRFMPGHARIYYRDTFAGGILDTLGFARPASQDRMAFADQVTKERIPEMDGDRLFYFVFETGDGEGRGAEQDWMDEPLWERLDVVRAGRVHRVSDVTWNSAGGILAAHLMLDDIETIYGLASQ